MKKDDFVNDYLTISGKEILVKCGYYPHVDLKFYEENPRLYSIIFAGEKSLTQEEIEERLSDKDYVKILAQSIKANGGLTDPIIVRGGDLVVLEGNSRLAAYRILAKRDPVKWSKIKCKMLPSNISDDLVFTLLGEYHIIGRKDWQPYEQAGYLFRRYKQQNIPSERIEKELGLKKKDIEHLIEVYSFMLKHGETDIARWSYYEEYIKSNYIMKARKEHPELDVVIVKKIKTGEIPKAVDIRDKLIPIAKASNTNIKKFISGKINFEATYEAAVAGGAGNVVFERLHRFRNWLATASVVDDILDNDEPLVKKCEFELGKIYKRINFIINKIKD